MSTSERVEGAPATVEVRGFTVVRDVFGANVVELVVQPPANLGAFLQALLERFGEPLRKLLWDREAGELTPFLIRVNDDILSSTLDRDRPLKSGDKIAIIFPIGGG